MNDEENGFREDEKAGMNTMRAVAYRVVSAGESMRADCVERWGIFEMVFRGPAEGNPYVEVRLEAEFHHPSGVCARAPGFYDGNGDYCIRFSPDREGEWTYQTRSSVLALDERRGTFRVGPPSAGNHGPVEVYRTFYFRYADGTPHHSFGTTCSPTAIAANLDWNDGWGIRWTWRNVSTSRGDSLVVERRGSSWAESQPDCMAQGQSGGRAALA